MAQTTLALLARNVAGALPDLNPTEQEVAVALYRLLGRGVPVSLNTVAERVGLPADVVANTMSGWPGVFYNDEQQVVGFWGLAQPEMPHRFTVGGKRLYTWCAWDTLFIPEILGKTAYVESRCTTTSERISLTVGPDGPQEVSPSDTVLSFLTPETPFDANMVMSFCHFVLFFNSPESGTTWIAKHPNTFLLSLEDAFEVGRLTNRAKFGDVLAKSVGFEELKARVPTDR